MVDEVDLKITLNGVDVTNYCDLNRSQPQIINAINAELDTLTLTLFNADAINPSDWQEIVIKNGSTKLFGGYVQTVDKSANADGMGNDYVLGCTDYGIYFDKVFVTREYEDRTDQEIIADIFTDSSLSEFDAVTNVSELKLLPRVRYNRKSIRVILDELCTLSGGNWYVDPEKKLHYFGSEEYSAPFNISDDPNEAGAITVQNLRSSTNGAGVFNLVEIVGGKYLSGDITEVLSANGRNVQVNLFNRMKPPDGQTAIVVRRNDGGPTTNLVVNPSFEVNITDGWWQYQAGTGAVWARDVTKFYAGAASLKITAGTAVAVLYGQSLTLNPGETLTVQARVWSPVVRTAAVVIWNVAGANLGECYNRKTSTWELVTAGYYNDTGAALTVMVQLYNNANDSTTACYYDAVQAEKLTWPSAYCDGSMGTGYAWTGTAHNSTSTRVNMSVWTTMNVKVGNQDTLSARDEVLYFESTAQLQQETFWPALDHAVEVDGCKEIPIRTVCRNHASYEHYGKWFKTVINATEIVDQTNAKLRAQYELAQNAMAKPAISYSTIEPGLRAGQMQIIEHSARGISGNYMIQRVTTTIGPGGFVNTIVEAGVADANLVRLFLSIQRALNPELEWNPNEVLDEIMSVTEIVTMDEVLNAFSAHTGEYRYGDGCRYGFAKYG